jgi:arsenical pump membrane protein
VAKGTDVYLFLIGMMLLSELARQEGLFDWLAAHTARAARGSPARLFTLTYAVGAIVTVFLSNDATAVVLTPAVAAVTRAARVENPVPYLLVCALIANAASFVLPISNPANLVIYGSHMPPLLQWLPRYALPSVASILATYAALRWSQRDGLHGTVSTDIEQPGLSLAGRYAAAGIGLAAIVLLAASASDIQLGWPTFLAAAATAILVLANSETGPATTFRNISWGVLPLVAGLFVIVEALDRAGVTAAMAGAIRAVTDQSQLSAAAITAAVLGVGTNLVNNLPAGLLAGRVVMVANSPDQVRAATLIGVDLGPNLSVTGSLATILWLGALKREHVTVTAWQFLKVGLVVMPPALILAVATTFIHF